MGHHEGLGLAAFAGGLGLRGLRAQPLSSNNTGDLNTEVSKPRYIQPLGPPKS